MSYIYIGGGSGGGSSTLSGLTDTTVTAASKGDLLVHNGTAWVDVTIGTNDQVLTADSAQSSGLKWAAASGGASDLDGLSDTNITAAAKGDLLVYDGSEWIDVGVGSNDQVLTADSAQASGIKWAAASGGGSYTQGDALDDIWMLGDF